MPPRSTPTARQRRLGAELRKLRENAGLSVTEAAVRLGTDRTKISNIEAGRFGLSAERVRALTGHYACANQTLVDALIRMTGERRRGWWEEYRSILPAGLLDLAELEHHSVSMRTVQVVTMPGLLQTVDHARSVFQNVVPCLNPPDIEHRLSFRMKRQVVLFRDNPLPYIAVIHEAALRMQLGGRSVVRSQLHHFLDMSEHEHITILVIPFDAGAYSGSGEAVCYASGPVPQLDTVQLDQSVGPLFLNTQAQLLKYETILDRTSAMALKPTKSRDFIHQIAQSL